MHNMLSNIAPGHTSLPYIPSRHGSRSQQNIFKGKNGSRSSASGGFTLLQGHIQLMAMVPNLPENELSPRPSHDTGRMETREVGQADNTPQLDGSCSPITPRLMPSASRFKRMRRAPHGFGHYPPSWHPSSPRTVSEMSLPPKPAKPVAMPSFGRHLPGTKRMTAESGIFQQYSSSNSSLPPATMTPQQHQQIFLNTCSTAGPTPNMTGNSGQFPPCPNMSYQMMNLVTPQQQGHHQQQYEYDMLRSQNNGSGDHHQMAQMLFHFQQQPHHQHHLQHQQQFQHHQPIQPSYDMPYSTYPTKEMQYGPPHQMLPQFPYGYSHPSPSFSHHPQLTSPSPRGSHPPPCAVQSLPCFGASSCGFGPSPMYSASMPHINFNGTPLSSPTSPSTVSQEKCDELPPLSKTKSTTTASAAGVKPCKSRSKLKQEVSILVEDSSVTSDDDSCLEGGNHKSSKKQTMNTTLPLISSPIDEEEIQHHHLPRHQPKQPLDNPKHSIPGPDSIPMMRIPPSSRVLHTPAKVEKECKDNEFCSNCKRCLGKLMPRLSTEESQAHAVEKVTRKSKKKSKGLITSGRRQKQTVVAVHDCFPSDSSITEEDYSDLDSPRKSSISNSNNNNCSASLRKRKPRMDAILQKAKTKFGDSSKVFDILHDLNPEEVRLFTCDYLVELLSSTDWSNCHLGLETMVRLARHRPKILLNFLGPILWYAFKHLTSPKSALCRAAIVTFTELFERIGSALDNDLEKLTEKLVVKSLAPNMFIREECDKALETMVNHCSLIKVLGAMESVSKKVNVRAACHRVARMTKQFIKVAGVDICLKPMYAEKILPMLFSFMTEANIQTRMAAKEALAMLMNHLQFEAAVTKHVTFDRNCTEVFKKLDKMRGRSKNRAYLWDTKK